MKKYLTAAVTAAILACLVGIPRANAQSGVGLAQEIREFSKRVGCGQLSEKDASTFAKAASSSKWNAERFKNVYNVSCAFKESMEAVKDAALAQTFEQVLKMSKSSSRCSGLTGAQALKVAKAALEGDIKVHTFAVAYFSDCSFEGPFAVAQMMTAGPAVEGLVRSMKDYEREESKRTEKLSKEDEELKRRWVEIELSSASRFKSAD